MNSPEIKVRVRAIIIRNNKLLVVVNDRDNFSYLPGGKLQPFETIIQTIERELKEEIGTDTQFKFQKIAYIKEFHDHKRNNHNIEFFVLGSINKSEEIEGLHDPEHNGTDHFSWVEISKLPENFLPQFLAKKILVDMQNEFENQPEYIVGTE